MIRGYPPSYQPALEAKSSAHVMFGEGLTISVRKFLHRTFSRVVESSVSFEEVGEQMLAMESSTVHASQVLYHWATFSAQESPYLTAAGHVTMFVHIKTSELYTSMENFTVCQPQRCNCLKDRHLYLHAFIPSSHTVFSFQGCTSPNNTATYSLTNCPLYLQ